MVETFKSIVPQPETPAKDLQLILKHNCLGSLFYFIKVGLRRNKLTHNLHEAMCKKLEADFVKDVIEYPRGHYKTTIHSEGWPLWRALPFRKQDEDYFTHLGYTDRFIKFMQKMHNPFIRILVVTSTDTNARNLGSLISKHVLSNAVYRGIFPETLPTRQDTWNTRSLQMQLPTTGNSDRGIHGEGTFDLLGVGNALQSRHYNIIIQDDLVGKAAVEQLATMEKVIDYHKLLPGAFDKDDAGIENDELIIGNRWSFSDLNSYIRENEPEFNFETHSAVGGCCGLHPADQIIFPERFSHEELYRIKRRFGNYYYSCQYLNSPISVEDADFKSDYLNTFKIELDNLGKKVIVHDVKDGLLKKDLYARTLKIVIATDPNHSGNVGNGRARHSIVVVGQSDNGDYYLLEYFAERCGYDKYYAKLYEIAKRWRVTQVGLETIAAQKYIKHHIETMNRISDWPLKIIELKGEVEGPDGQISRKKEWRVRSALGPVFERGAFWIQPKMQDFLNEYLSFPRCKTWDILDALAYTPNMLDKVVNANTMKEWYAANAMRASQINRPYSVGNRAALSLVSR